MLVNYGLQNQAQTAFLAAAAASPPVDIRGYVGFSFTANVHAAIAADAIFNVQAAPPSDADPCLPGTFVDVPEVPICAVPAQPAAMSHFTIPAGTPPGSRCSIFMPCKPDAFIQVLPVSGTTASVEIVVGLHGPK
jgi:hypothetical protein